MTAIPITIQLFKIFNLKSFINNIIGVFNSSLIGGTEIINESTSSMNGFANIGQLNITGPINRLSQSITGVLDTTAVNIGSMFVTIIIFAICMFICQIIIKGFQGVFEKIPIGKTINTIFGIVCGAVKGIIIVLILYFIFALINSLFHASIPLDDGIVNKTLGVISGFIIK